MIRTTMTAELARSGRGHHIQEPQVRGTGFPDHQDRRPGRPADHHYLAGRVAAHLLICMLAATSPGICGRPSPSSPSPTSTSPTPPTPSHPRSAPRGRKTKTPQSRPPTGCRLPVPRPARAPVHPRPADHQFQRAEHRETHRPTPVQARAFELLGAPVPLTLQ